MNAIDLEAGRTHCQQEGCTEWANPCFLPTEDAPHEWLCPEHAAAAGYCAGCFEFWAGVEVFDFSPSHLCANCQSEFDEYLDDEPAYDYEEAWP